MRIGLRLGLTTFVALGSSGAFAFAQTPPATTPAQGAVTAAPANTAATPAPPVLSPKLVAAQAVKDVGRVAKSEKVDVAFVLRNEGGAPLTISDVRPTCGCTVAKFDALIAPGASGEVHASVDTADFNGPITKTLTVLSNDPATPRLTLTIKALVQPQVESRPGFARFNFVQDQEPITVKQTLWATDHDGFAVLDVKSPYKFVQAKFHKATPEELDKEIEVANQWIVETTIAPDAEVGALRDFLVVKTNHPKQKELRLAITGFVRPILTVTPYIADFGAVAPSAETKDISIIVTNFGKDPVEITKVTSALAGVETTVKSLEAGKRFEIKLALSPAAMAKGAIDSTLKIETSSPKKPVLDVPLKGSVS